MGLFGDEDGDEMALEIEAQRAQIKGILARNVQAWRRYDPDNPSQRNAMESVLSQRWPRTDKPQR
jgi:hypothetical protein